ncbi:MAG: lysophospholipase [Pirellulales bacterium]|nr:lysophospholipase [Pirellulales bacterium]
MPGFADSQNSSSIHRRSWLPEGASRAVVVVVHGFTEHSGRYEHVARELNARGVAVHALDLRGHGRSGGRRAWIESFGEYLDDVENCVAGAREACPGVPLFLLGHSMGGVIVGLLAIEHRVETAGLIFSAPAICVDRDVFPLLRRLAALMSRVWPRLRVVRMGCGRLSRDPANVERFRADPLVVHERFPVRTGAEILAAGDRLWHEGHAIETPIMVLHGTGDRVADPEGSRRLYDQAASTDKTLKLYDGLYHDLFGEPEKDQVIGDLVEWVVERC